jgi:hypothetical protein
MKEFMTEVGPVGLYTPKETLTAFVPLRDRIFDNVRGGVDIAGSRIFRDDTWTKVIIRGALIHSDRTDAGFRPTDDDEELLDWAKDDPRDELLPLLDLLVEDGIEHVIHMFPGFKDKENDAVTTRPTRAAIRAEYDSYGANLPERLIFDDTAKWGFMAEEYLVGILGGTPEFMNRYIDRCGGINYIRKMADNFWRRMIHTNQITADCVVNCYKLAGWDNPPVN